MIFPFTFLIGKRGRKKKVDVPQKQVVGEQTEEPIHTEEKPVQIKEAVSKKPRKPVPEGHNTGVYTELEEQRFLEGLELFGRDWTKVY